MRFLPDLLSGKNIFRFDNRFYRFKKKKNKIVLWCVFCENISPNTYTSSDITIVQLEKPLLIVLDCAGDPTVDQKPWALACDGMRKENRAGLEDCGGVRVP